MITTSLLRRHGKATSLAKLAIGAAVAVGALAAGSARAYVVTVGGVKYDVTTFTGSYVDNTSKFQTAANGGAMPWWGSGSVAAAFANAVGSNLGTPNGGEGPGFAYNFEGYFDPDLGPIYFVDFIKGTSKNKRFAVLLRT